MLVLLACALALIIIFPNRNKLTDILQDAEPTLNTVQVLAQWLDENPNDNQARLSLARKHLENYQPHQAYTALYPLIEARPKNKHLLPQYWQALMLLHRATAQLKASGEAPNYPQHGLSIENATDPSMPIALRLALAEQSNARDDTFLTRRLLLPNYFKDSSLSAMQVIHAMKLLFEIEQNHQATAVGLKAFSANQNATLWYKILKTLMSAQQMPQAIAFFQSTPDNIQQSAHYRENIIKHKLALTPDALKVADITIWLNTNPTLKDLQAALSLTLAHTKLAQSEALAKAWYHQTPNDQDAQQHLHDILRWQGKIAEALLISEQRLASHPSKRYLDVALEEAWALSDYPALGRLYQLAIFNNWIDKTDVPRTVEVLDRALPDAKVTDALAALYDTHPDSHFVREHYLQRLANRQDHDAIIKIWRELPAPTLRLSLTLRKQLARQAYQQGIPRQALEYLTRGIRWANVGDPTYLSAATQIAQRLSRTQTSEAVALQEFKLTGDSFDYYLSIRQAHRQDEAKIADALMNHYKETKNPTLLALTTQHAQATQNDRLALRLLDLVTSDPDTTPVTSLWIYVARIYQAQGNPAAAEAALDNAFLTELHAPELQYQHLAQILALNQTSQIERVFAYYNKDPDAVTPELWSLMAETADRLNDLPNAIMWYTKAAQNEEQDDPWPIYRLAVLLAQAGEVDRSYYLKKHLLSTLGTPNPDQLHDVDLLILDEFLGQQLGAHYMAQRLAHHLQLHVRNQAKINHTGVEATQDIPVQIMHADQQTPLMFASGTSNSQIQALYQQLVTRLLDNYQYYAVKQWQTLEANTGLALAPWQRLTLAQTQTRADAKKAVGEALIRTPSSLTQGAYYEALLLAGQNQQAWRYGQAKFNRDTERPTTKAPASHRRFNYQPHTDITDYNYLRELHLSQLSQKAHKWTAYYKFLADRDADSDSHNVALNYQVPSQWGAWQANAFIGKVPRSEDLLFQNTSRQMRSLSVGHRWLSHPLTAEAFATISVQNNEDILGLKGSLSGAIISWLGQSNWQVSAGWRQPFNYNIQLDFLSQSDHLGFSLDTAHNTLLSSFISFRQDNIKSTAGDSLGRGYRMYAELRGDLFRTDLILGPYVAWYQQKFDLNGSPSDILPGLTSALNSPITQQTLFLDDYSLGIAGLRRGNQNDSLVTRPVEHIFDIGFGYEPVSKRRGYTVTDQWKFRFSARQFLRFKLGLNELSPNGSREAWVELGFEQLMD
jgi:hypothetical protein